MEIFRLFYSMTNVVAKVDAQTSAQTRLYPYSTQATNRANRHELIFIGGIREVLLKKKSPIDSVPIQIRFRYECSGESA